MSAQRERLYDAPADVLVPGAKPRVKKEKKGEPPYLSRALETAELCSSDEAGIEKNVSS